MKLPQARSRLCRAGLLPSPEARLPSPAIFAWGASLHQLRQDRERRHRSTGLHLRHRSRPRIRCGRETRPRPSVSLHHLPGLALHHEPRRGRGLSLPPLPQGWIRRPGDEGGGRSHFAWTAPCRAAPHTCSIGLLTAIERARAMGRGSHAKSGRMSLAGRSGASPEADDRRLKSAPCCVPVGTTMPLPTRSSTCSRKPSPPEDAVLASSSPRDACGGSDMSSWGGGGGEAS